MKKTMKWRLSKLPTADEVAILVRDGIITKEEAKDILFREETDERDVDSYKEEIKFLRGLVEKLSTGNTTRITEYIYHKPYSGIWYQPYYSWCSSASQDNAFNTVTTTAGSGNLTYYAGSSGSQLASANNQIYASNDVSALGQSVLQASASNFSDIKTF